MECELLHKGLDVFSYQNSQLEHDQQLQFTFFMNIIEHVWVSYIRVPVCVPLISRAFRNKIVLSIVVYV
jgi:hypothetical protein